MSLATSAGSASRTPAPGSRHPDRNSGAASSRSPRYARRRSRRRSAGSVSNDTGRFSGGAPKADRFESAPVTAASASAAPASRGSAGAAGAGAGVRGAPPLHAQPAHPGARGHWLVHRERGHPEPRDNHAQMAVRGPEEAAVVDDAPVLVGVRLRKEPPLVLSARHSGSLAAW